MERLIQICWALVILSVLTASHASAQTGAVESTRDERIRTALRNPAFPIDELPQASVSLPDGGFIVASSGQIRHVDANGVLRAGWSTGLGANAACQWESVANTGFLGHCTRTFIVGEGENAQTRQDIFSMWCAEGSCATQAALSNVPEADYRSLSASMAVDGRWYHLVLQRAQAGTNGSSDTPELVLAWQQGRVVETQVVDRHDPAEDDNENRLRVGNLGTVQARVVVDAYGRLLWAVRVGTILRVYRNGELLGDVSSAYDWHLISAGTGVDYVIYYEPESRSLQYAGINQSGFQSPLFLDTAESGFESDVLVSDAGVEVWYYYYRNAFNKGVRVARLDWNGRATPPVQVLTSESFNFGWGVASSALNFGSSLVCFGEGQSAQLSLSSNQSPEIPSGWCVRIPVAETHVTVQESRFPRYRPFFFMAGGGIWYRPWEMWSISPDSEDLNGTEPFDLRYEVGAALQTEATLEGRVGRTRLGMSWAQSIASDIEDELLADAPPLLARQLRGLLSVDRLLGNHDLQLQFRSSLMRAEVRDFSSNQLAPALIETRANEVWLSAMNIYRMRYGLRYQNFDTQIPVYEYFRPGGDTSFSFQRAWVQPTQMHDIGLIFGYSLLDYAVKYETRMSRFYLDTTFGAGVAIARPTGDERVKDQKTPVTLSAFGELEAGLLLYRRFAGLRQLGFYTRIGARVWGEWRGFAGKPEDIETDAENFDEDETRTQFNLVDVRYGPFIQVGAVF